MDPHKRKQVGLKKKAQKDLWIKDQHVRTNPLDGWNVHKIEEEERRMIRQVRAGLVFVDEHPPIIQILSCLETKGENGTRWNDIQRKDYIVIILHVSTVSFVSWMLVRKRS